MLRVDEMPYIIRGKQFVKSGSGIRIKVKIEVASLLKKTQGTLREAALRQTATTVKC